MPILDLRFHRKGYANNKRSRLIGGVITQAPVHGIQLHRWIPVEDAHNPHPSSHETVSIYTPQPQSGRGLDSISMSNESDQDRLLRMLSVLPTDISGKKQKLISSDIRSWI